MKMGSAGLNNLFLLDQVKGHCDQASCKMFHSNSVPIIWADMGWFETLIPIHLTTHFSTGLGTH